MGVHFPVLPSILLLDMFEIIHNKMFKNINIKQLEEKKDPNNDRMEDGLEGVFTGIFSLYSLLKFLLHLLPCLIE